MFGSPNRTGAWLNFAQRSRDEGGLGLAPHQAAGLVGNLVNESGQDLNPWGPSGDNGTAWGTAQWRGDRLAGLQDYARKNGLDHRSMEAQQGWMRQEFDGPEAKAYAALTAATTPEEAASAVNQHYERSADTSGNRERAARELMTQFGSDDTSPGALTSSFAPTEKKKSMPAALSTDNTMGPGILNMNGADGGDDPVARGLVGLGSALAGISNPEQGKALAALQANMAKVPGNKWTVAHVDPKTGQAMLTNGTSFVPTNFFTPKPDEDEYAKAAKVAAAKSNQDLGDSINQAARDSAATGETVAEARAAMSGLKSPDQGILGPARQTLAKVYNAFGFGDPEKVANGDVASALSNKLALQMVNSGGTKLLPGSFSDSDRKFVVQMSTSLSNTPEANQRLLDLYERSNRHIQEAEALRAAHVAKNDGVIMPSFRQELGELSQKHLKQSQEEAAARTAAAPAAMTAQKPVNTFTAKNGKTINWSY
jgi:hypothetical protein